MKRATDILHNLRKGAGGEQGIETFEFTIIFVVFMMLTLLVIQVFFFFANSIAVNTALVDASQRASAQGGLTKDVNDVFMNSVPRNICGGAPTPSPDPDDGGKLICPNAALKSDTFKPDGTQRPITGCPDNESTAIGEECSRFGDRIALSAQYYQPLLIDYDCLAGGTSTPGQDCTSSAGTLQFNQQLSVGSQSLIGVNKPTP